MKKLEELGISQWPWDITPNICGEYDVTAKDSTLVVAYELPDMKPHDIENRRLIASAPELYACLCDAVVEMCHAYCDRSDGKCGKKDGECFVQEWIKTLEEASGESEEK